MTLGYNSSFGKKDVQKSLTEITHNIKHIAVHTDSDKEPTNSLIAQTKHSVTHATQTPEVNQTSSKTEIPNKSSKNYLYTGKDEKTMKAKHTIFMGLENTVNAPTNYETQVQRYRQLGWLKEHNGVEGIEGNDGIFYELPALDKVLALLMNKFPEIKEKSQQGFTRFMLVPMALSRQTMFETLENEYKRFAEDPRLGLYRTDQQRTRITTVHTGGSASLKDADDTTYYPFQEEDSLGKTKQELTSTQIFPGWELHILHEEVAIPKKDAPFQFTNNQRRFTIPAGQNTKEYLQMLYNSRTTNEKEIENLRKLDAIVSEELRVKEFLWEYRYEVGLTEEVAITLALDTLHKQKTVLWDWENNDRTSVCMLTGMATNNGSSVPAIYFDSQYNRMRLDHNPIEASSPSMGTMSSVKVDGLYK